MLVGIYHPSPLQMMHSHPECPWEPNVSTWKISNSIYHEREKTAVSQSYCKGIVLACRAGSSTFYQLYPTVNFLPFLTALPPSDKLTAIGFTGLFMGNTRRQHSQQSGRKLHLMLLLFVPSLPCASLESILRCKAPTPGLREHKSLLNYLRQRLQGKGGNCFCTAQHLCLSPETPISPLRLHQPRPSHG